MKERWKVLQGYGQSVVYFVSSEGRIVSRRRSTGRFRLLGPKIDSRGYRTVRLSKPGMSQKNYAVHVLVLEAFVGPRPSAGMVARHLNDKPLDNRLVNLAWGTQLENVADQYLNGGRIRPIADDETCGFIAHCLWAGMSLSATANLLNEGSVPTVTGHGIWYASSVKRALAGRRADIEAHIVAIRDRVA